MRLERKLASDDNALLAGEDPFNYSGNLVENRGHRFGERRQD